MSITPLFTFWHALILSTHVHSQMASSGTVMVVGFRSSNNNRSCHAHSCCGHCVQAEQLVCFKFTVVDGHDGPEEGIAFVAVRRGQELWRAGFLPRQLSEKSKYVDKFAQVIEMYQDHEDVKKRRDDNTMYGVAECFMVDHIPSFE